MQGAFSEKGERSHKILVVEDDEILAAEIELLLQRVGCSVVAKASCFEEALSMALESKPDLILMDIFLKGERDGVEAAQAILRKTSLPIVYMTAATDRETLERAKQTGPFGYILKPVQEKELETTIEIALFKHRLEEERRKREELLFTILHNLSDAVVFFDYREGLRFINSAARDIANLEEKNSSDLTPERLFPLLTTAGYPLSDDPARRVFLYGRGERGEYLLERFQGDPVPVEVSCFPIRTGKGDESGVVMVLRDLREKRKYEESLVKVRKYESLSVAAEGLARDFNGILSNILENIALEKVHRKMRGDSPGRLANVEEAVLKAKELTERLRRFSKAVSLQKGFCPLENLFRQTVLATLDGSCVEARFDVQERLPTLEIDEDRVRTLIVNLAKNALKAVPEGGRIEASLKKVLQSGESELPPGEYLQMGFTAWGPEVPVEPLFSTFDPSSPPESGDDGLDLAVTYWIVHKHGGRIDVLSHPEGESTFTVLLPFHNP